jgi:hypothetical protein
MNLRAFKAPVPCRAALCHQRLVRVEPERLCEIALALPGMARIAIQRFRPMKPKNLAYSQNPIIIQRIIREKLEEFSITSLGLSQILESFLQAGGILY